MTAQVVATVNDTTTITITTSGSIDGHDHHHDYDDTLLGAEIFFLLIMVWFIFTCIYLSIYASDNERTRLPMAIPAP